MAKVSTYLNFSRQTKEAFELYKKVFKTEYLGIFTMRDAPAESGQPEIKEEDKGLIMHVALPILGGYVLMGTDAPACMGSDISFGNNISINLEPDTLEEAQRLFGELSDGGVVHQPLEKSFWGAYYASFSDRFGVNWMINCELEGLESFI
jgi:PhnB protein